MAQKGVARSGRERFIKTGALIRVAPISVLALIASSCAMVGSTDSGAAAIPLAPPIVAMNSPEPPPAPDGLDRFVLTPVVKETPSLETGSEKTLSLGVDTGSGTELSIDRRLFEALPEAELIIRGGVAGYLNTTGQFVPLNEDAASVESAPDERAEAGLEPPEVDEPESMSVQPKLDPTIEQLEQVKGVVSVVAIGDGSYAVATNDPDAIAALASSESTVPGLGPLTISIDPPLALATDPYGPYQWAMDNTGDNLASVQSPAPAQLADADVDGRESATGPQGAGVIVAVIDSGVDFSHPDLAGQSWANPGETCGNGIDDDSNGFIDDCAGWDFGYEDNIPWSSANQDHGTHVAGIIAATADNGIGVAGLAPAVKIMDLSVDGPGGISTSSVARAIRYATDNGADVINMSLGTSPGTPRAAVLPMIAAVEHAAAAGVVVVVAAGNSNVNLGNSAVYPASIDAENMIVVGAATPTETRASFSNYGEKVTLFAPGQLILSTVPGNGYVFMSGTSQASPMVAAAAAAVLENAPDSDPPSVRDQLVGTGDEIATYTPYAANGVRLNSAAAVGVDPDSAGVNVTIGGLAGGAESITAAITMADPDAELDEPHYWEASLVMVTDDGAFGIVDHPVTIGGTEAMTDDRGSVPLAPSQATEAAIDTELPPGTYALVIEAVLTADPSVRLGDAFISTFDVDDPNDQSGPDPDPTATTGQTTTTTTTPGSTPSTTSIGQTTSTTSAATTSTSSSPNSPSTTVSPTTGPATTGPSTTAQSGTSPTTSPAPTTSTSSSNGQTTTGQGPVQTTVATTTTVTQPSAPLPTTAPRPPTTITVPITAPVTTVPLTTVPLTTVPSTTVPSSTAATTAATSPASTVDGWAFYGLDPSTGPQDGGTMVSILGKFPTAAYVWFGDQLGDVVFQSESWILVITPESTTAGPVDVTFRTIADGNVLTVPNRYNYIGSGPPASPSPTSTPTTAPTATTSTSTGQTTAQTASTTSTSAPSGQPTTTSEQQASTTTSAPESTTTTRSPSQSTTRSPSETTEQTAEEDAGSPLRRDRGTAGQSIDLGNGLRGARLSGFGNLDDVPRCTSDPCRVRRSS